MIHWAWLVAAVFGGVLVGVLLMGICAAAGIDGAYREGYERGLALGRRIGYDAGLCDTAVTSLKEREAA
jgi:hypothetical protein